MKYKIIFLLTFFNVSYSNAQALPYYPLHINDRWEINDDLLKLNKGQLSKVIKDTITADSLRYFVIVHSDTTLGEIRYERYDSGAVYRLNIHTRKEELWFDFTKKMGDSVVIVHSNDTDKIYLNDTSTENILGASRKCWWFIIRSNMSLYADEIEIADSIGIVQYVKFNPLIWSQVSLSVVGAFINGKLIRTSYPYIYLPFHPGNWWKFDEDPGIISVMQDTVMPNGKTYAMILWGSDNKYFRQDSNFVFSYDPTTQQEEIEMDMSAPSAQIWDLNFWHGNIELTASGGIRTQKVFSMDRRTYSYGIYLPSIADAWVSYTYADSFGIINIGSMVYTGLIEAQVDGRHYTLTSAGKQSTNVPAQYSLEQNYPNPFNSTTIITYSIPTRSFVSLRIYDLLGRLVTTLVNNEKSPGTYKAEWNAEDWSSGIYFYRLQSDIFTATKKILLLR